MNQINSFKNGLIIILMLFSILFIIERFEFGINYNSSQVETIENSISEELQKEKELYQKKVKTLIDVIWCENRQSKESMKLVLSVIYNRAKEKTLDGLYEEVIKPYQFTCLNKEEILASQSRGQKDLEMYEVAKQIVNKFINGKFNPLIEATFYYNPFIVENKPKYLEDKPLLLSFENHDFY